MAARTGITVSFTAIRSNVRYIKSAQIMSNADSFTHKWCEELIKDVKVYPEEYANPSYVRTYKLYLSWKIVPASKGFGIAYEVQNKVKDRYGRYYARLVHGGPRGDGQWPHHDDTGWLRIWDVIYDLGGRKGFRDSVQHIMDKYAT